MLRHVVHRRFSLAQRLNFNNFQDRGSDALPARSFINSLFCQQVDIDWLNLYPTLPSQQIALIAQEESDKLSRLVRTGEDLEDCLDELRDSIALDAGLPISCGGDPGPPGAALMLQCVFAEGLGDNLPCARVYSRHQAAIGLLLKYGGQKQKDAACIDAVAGMLTGVEVGGSLKLENGTLNGSVYINGADQAQLTNLLLRVQSENGSEQLILLNKSAAGITVGEPLDEFHSTLLEFENVQVEDEMFIPFESDTEVMNQIQFYEDYYNLLISAAVLGGMKRSLNATLESHSMRTMGSLKMIKSGLVKSQLARTQTPLYKLETCVYGTAGKWPWSSESLSAESYGVRSMANSMVQVLDRIGEFSGHLFLTEPWSTRRRHLRHLSQECPSHACFSLIGIRGFQAHLSQQCGIAKRLSQAFPYTREWRRLVLWGVNWRRQYPELVSFGYSTTHVVYAPFNDTKTTSTRRALFRAIKHNNISRTKKDGGTGTWADESHDLVKRMKFSFEYAMRDYCKQVCVHGEQYGTTVPEQEWLVELMGRAAVELFAWGQLMARMEKSHQSSVRGFEHEKALASLAQNEAFESIVNDIDLATSTWYDETRAPLGRQRALDELELGADLMKINSR